MYLGICRATEVTQDDAFGDDSGSKGWAGGGGGGRAKPGRGTDSTTYIRLQPLPTPSLLISAPPVAQWRTRDRVSTVPRDISSRNAPGTFKLSQVFGRIASELENYLFGDGSMLSSQWTRLLFLEQRFLGGVLLSPFLVLGFYSLSALLIFIFVKTVGYSSKLRILGVRISNPLPFRKTVCIDFSVQLEFLIC